MATPSKDPTPTASPVVPPSISDTEQLVSSSFFGFHVSTSPPTPKHLELEDDVLPASPIRPRSRSPGRFGVRWSIVANETPPGSPSSGWWGKSTDGSSAPQHRPWRDPPKRKRTIPPEQTEGWDHTKLVCFRPWSFILSRLSYISPSPISVSERLRRLFWESLEASPTRPSSWLLMFSISLPYQGWLSLPRCYSTSGIPFNLSTCVATSQPVFALGPSLTILSTNLDQPYGVPPPHRTMCGYPTLRTTGN